MTKIPPALIAGLALFSLVVRAQVPPVFRNLELVDEIHCATSPASPDRYREHPAGIAVVEKQILGQAVRILPNDKPGLKYFGYRLGRGKGLEANAAYVLEIEYPEDAPRSFFVINQGAETTRGFHTGPTLGDALKPKYVNNQPESLALPLAGEYRKWQMLFHLHERFPDQLRPRDHEHPRDQTPRDGFWVFVAQFEPENAPMSAGAAVARIRLYKAPPFEDYALKLNLPPDDLPRRHLFWREEMSDGVIGREDRGFATMHDWYVHKARLHRFLGMNTFAKDLLEFGANQGWDSSPHGGNRWVYQSHDPQRWSRIVKTATEHGLNLLPYYEYSGGKGAQGLGDQRRAIPLGDQDNYTHIAWTETARADLTDPDTFEDLRKILELTIGRFKGDGTFVGAWLRPRSSQLPISFSDAALNRFTVETARTAAVTRAMLRTDAALYAAYKRWWMGKRVEFLAKVRDYTREASGNPGAVLLYTADTTEAGRPHPDNKRAGLVAEEPEKWAAAGHTATALASVLAERRQFEALTLPASTWGKWEWRHAAPEYDPASFRDQPGLLPTFSFNRSWTVADAAAFDAFRSPDGLAIVRHYSLNEDMFREPANGGRRDDLFGYFVSDVELAGPFCMLAETRAVAEGDPFYIGYLASSSFNRGFPQYARNFNAAFLALPAIRSARLDGVTSDPDVVVRRIDAGKHGIYFAVANTGYRSKSRIELRLPDRGKVLDAATSDEIAGRDKAVVLDLYPAQLRALRVVR